MDIFSYCKEQYKSKMLFKKEQWISQDWMLSQILVFLLHDV